MPRGDPWFFQTVRGMPFQTESWIKKFLFWTILCHLEKKPLSFHIFENSMNPLLSILNWMNPTGFGRSTYLSIWTDQQWLFSIKKVISFNWSYGQKSPKLSHRLTEIASKSYKNSLWLTIYSVLMHKLILLSVSHFFDYIFSKLSNQITRCKLKMDIIMMAPFGMMQLLIAVSAVAVRTMNGATGNILIPSFNTISK